MEISPLDIIKLSNRPETFRNRLLRRSEVEIGGTSQDIKKVISDIKNRGDLAVLDYTERFDDVKLGRDQIKVKQERIERAKKEIHPKKYNVMKEAAENIEKFHERLVPEDWMDEMADGVSAGQVVRPINTVGIYAPGGNADYPSTVLMSAIPAKLAGVERIVLCTPPNSRKSVNEVTLVAADIASVDEIYKVGGSQAVVSMAYGTKTIPKVDKIVGPGNIYVAGAKKAVSNDVSIDFVAGPSEVLILADSSTNPRYVALDMVAQAEHDSSAASVLVTTSMDLAEKVQEEVKSVLEDIPRERTAAKALEEYGNIIVVENLDQGVEFANDYAPEHLEIMTRRPDEVVDRIKHAGAIFIGSNSPTSAGDFVVGPSHVLPTGRQARAFAGLSVQDFIRRPSIQKLSKDGLREISDAAMKLANIEGLDAHAKSIEERLGE